MTTSASPAQATDDEVVEELWATRMLCSLGLLTTQLPRDSQLALCTDAYLIPRTLPTPASDPTDATRGYPPDSTDESNSLIQIAFD